MTTESSKTGAITLSRNNFSAYVRHMIVFSILVECYHCMLFSSMVRVRIRFGVWLVNDYAHVFILISAVIVTLPLEIRQSR